MIILYSILLWAIFATAIYLKKKWNHKQTLENLVMRTIFVFVINLIFSPICVYFNLKELNHYLRKHKRQKKCSPTFSLLTQPSH